MEGTCYCGYHHLIKGVDFIQPTDPEFQIIYGHDPFAEQVTNAKEQKEQKQLEKQQLDEKYHNMFRHTQKHVVTPDEKYIRKEVLGGGTIVEEAIASNKERLKKEAK